MRRHEIESGALFWPPILLVVYVVVWLLAGCATDPALRAYDRAVGLGLAVPRVERANARLCEWPGDRAKCVEIAR